MSPAELVGRLWMLDAAAGLSETASVLIAQLSDVHVGGSRYREELLRTAIEEIQASGGVGSSSASETPRWARTRPAVGRARRSC